MDEQQANLEEPENFAAVLKGIAEGDDKAADAFMRYYYGHVLREVRRRMEGSRLRGYMESADVCQSVLCDMFRGVVTGKIRLSEPGAVLQLIVPMVRHKLANRADQHHAARRDGRRLSRDPVESFYLASREGDPSEEISLQEEIEVFEARLSLEERQILDLSKEGRSFREVSHTVGRTPDAVRMCVARLLANIKRQRLE